MEKYIRANSADHYVERCCLFIGLLFEPNLWVQIRPYCALQGLHKKFAGEYS